MTVVPSLWLCGREEPPLSARIGVFICPKTRQPPTEAAKPRPSGNSHAERKAIASKRLGVAGDFAAPLPAYRLLSPRWRAMRHPDRCGPHRPELFNRLTNSSRNGSHVETVLPPVRLAGRATRPIGNR